jgi:hypothetical protein
MLLRETVVQRIDVVDVLLERLAGDIEKGVTISLDGLTSTRFTKSVVRSPSQHTPDHRSP